MTDRFVYLSALRRDLVAFIDELIQMLPNDKQLIIMREFAKIVIIADVADYIVQNIVPLEPKVVARDDKYFLTNAIMFEKLQDRESQVNHFKTLWETNADDENKEVIWQWLEHFIQIAKKYRASLGQ